MTFRSAVEVVDHIGDDDTTALPVARQATTSRHLTTPGDASFGQVHLNM